MTIARMALIVCALLVPYLLGIGQGAGTSPAMAAPAAPGESVVGSGRLPGAPELIIHRSAGNDNDPSAGNDVFLVAPGVLPAAYGGGPLNIANECVGGADGFGFADLGSGDFSYPTKKHQYTFTFTGDSTVAAFSLVVYDWGDFLPFGACPGSSCGVAMAAYNATNDLVASDHVTFTSASDARVNRPSGEFGPLATAGDACQAVLGQPGKAVLSVTGNGITRVTVKFASQQSIDPHVALGFVRYVLADDDGDGVEQVEFVPGTAKVWIGLKNSDAVGLRLDVRAEVFAEGLMVGTGQISNVPAGGSGFNNAQLRAIALAATPLSVADGAPLDLRVSVRRTCSGTGHQSGVVRLWYDGPAIDSGTQRNAGSRLEAILDEATVSYYLRTGSALSEAVGTVRTYRDVAVDSSQPCPSRPFTPFGTWSTALD